MSASHGTRITTSIRSVGIFTHTTVDVSVNLSGGPVAAAELRFGQARARMTEADPQKTAASRTDPKPEQDREERRTPTDRHQTRRTEEEEEVQPGPPFVSAARANGRGIG